MRKFLLMFVIICLLITPVSAAPLSGADKAQAAGELISEVMELIISQYAGGDVSVEDLYEAALYGMAEILDPYSEYLNEDDWDSFAGSLSGRLTGIGVTMRNNKDGQPEITRVLPGSPAQGAGLQKGDVIVTVNGVSMVDASTSDVVDVVLDPEITSVRMQVRRNGNLRVFDMVKAEIKSVTVFTDKLDAILGPSVRQSAADYRYIAVTSVSETTASDLREAINLCKKENVKGIVLDFRGNTGGYLDVAVNICNQLVPTGAIYHTLDSQNRRRTYNSFLRQVPFEKIAVLVDAYTASASELIAAALQDSKAAVIIGETTFGKGVIQTMYPLPVGGVFKLTTEEYLRRSGKPINKIGVTPDIEVEMDPYEYETPNDAALIKALEWMNGK